LGARAIDVVRRTVACTAGRVHGRQRGRKGWVDGTSPCDDGACRVCRRRARVHGEASTLASYAGWLRVAVLAARRAGWPRWCTTPRPGAGAGMRWARRVARVPELGEIGGGGFRFQRRHDNRTQGASGRWLLEGTLMTSGPLGSGRCATERMAGSSVALGYAGDRRPGSGRRLGWRARDKGSAVGRH
jgi:hypothetical protein